MSPNRTVSKQEQTYTILRERILEGVYGPGHRLVIDALARELHVSPMPVREAIRRLEAEGWVVYQRNHGAQVAPVDAASWTEAMTTLAVLEGFATALSAAHLDADDLARLRQINGEMHDALETLDVMAVSQRNQAFHEAIYACCPNAHLRMEVATTTERLNTMRTTIFSYIPTRGVASIREHEELLVMIEQQDGPQEIELFAREHKLRTVEAYQRHRAGDVQARAAAGLV